MITLKSQREIDLMEKSGAFLASIHIGLRDLICLLYTSDAADE